jgi:hypothetical protein
LFLRNRSLQQVLRVKGLQKVRDKQPILAHQQVVKPNFTAAIFRPLNAHKIPVYRRAVAVVAVGVGVAGRKVEAARDLLVEQDSRIGAVMTGLTPSANSPT